MIKSLWLGIGILISSTILLLWPGFGQVIEHPNGFLFTNTGDGLKNYFNLGYYLKYNTGLEFSGVNYPYGENLLYTDTHPFYALLLNLIDNNVVSIAANSVAIINLSILGGFILGAVLIYLILIHYQMPVWYAILISLGITFLSPQWDRLHGHLSLSYAFVIPLFWYLLLQVEKRKTKRLWLFVLAFWGLLVGGIHLYYLAMGSGFILSYVLVDWLSNRISKIKVDFPINAGLILSATFPIAIILLISNLTDSVQDRPMAPYGFYVYHATIESVFLPHYSAATTFLSRLIQLSINWEGRAFIGTLSLFFCLGFLANRFYKLMSKSQAGLHLISDMSRYVGASILMLLFSMCIPFEWGLQFIPELITPFKQFRALGRFSWIFFYVINIAASAYIYRLLHDFSESKYKQLRPAGFTIIILVWIFDAGSFYLNHGPVSIVHNDKLENTSKEYLDRFADANINPNEFQAIFSLPLVAVRTDKMTFEKNMSAHNEAMKCAFHTGLPIIQSSASRPSLSQTLSSIQLISSPYISKNRLIDMDRRPLLLLYKVGSDLQEAERSILRQGELFWEDQYIQLYRLSLEAFKDSTRHMMNLYEISGNDSTFVEISGQMRCTPDCTGVLYKSFDDHALYTKALFGKSSWYSKSKSMVLLDTTLSMQGNVSKEASFWIYIDPDFAGMPSYEYFFGPEKAQLSSEGRVESRDLSEIYNQWVRVSIPLKNVAHHKIIVYGSRTTIDSLMVKSSDQTVFVKDGTQILYNNYVLR